MKTTLPGRIALATITATIALSSCSTDKWKAEGEIKGADNASLVLEAPNSYGGWYPMDTITTDSRGRFSVSAAPAGHPEVFRLSMGKRAVYFPIDSLETVTIATDTADFGVNYTISGSPQAEAMQKINNLIAKAVKEKGENAVATDSVLKREVYNQILNDPAGIVAYYTIFRRVGNTYLFNPQDKGDLRMIGAVANAFATHRPTDPRTEFLKHIFISNRKAAAVHATPTDTIVAQEIKLPEIALLDCKGKNRSLTEVASQGNVVLLNFTAYSAEASPAFNLELAKVYNANKDKGFEIYQISIDEDEFFWRQAAQNLPWIAVYNAPKNGIEALLKYNVGAIPATFIINRNGDLVERIDDITQIGKAVARHI